MTRSTIFALVLAACTPEKASAPEADEDGDGFALSEDCDDTDAAVNPQADERCDDQQVDEDCNGLADDEDPGVEVESMSTWFVDADGDGLGSAIEVSACVQPPETSANSDDCDDSDAAVLGASEWFEDADEDGVGGDMVRLECVQPAGFIALGGDCDDSDPEVSPLATERCDPLGIDEDCNGLAEDYDPAADPETKEDWYLDVDGDGYGAGASFPACHQPAGMSINSVDCDDTSAERNPGVDETCTGVDDDCDGLVDEADPDWDVALGEVLSPDLDGDGFFGDAAFVCAGKAGWFDGWTDLDCDDEDPAVSPGADEICEDGIDNDCDVVDTLCWGDTGELLGIDDADVLITDLGGGLVDVVSDLDGDGFDELFVGTQRIEGPLTAGTWSLGDVAHPPIASTLPYRLIVGSADANDDGVLDLVVGLLDVEVWLGPAFDSPEPYCAWQTTPGFTGRVIEDVNGDGMGDFVSASAFESAISMVDGVCDGAELARLEGPPLSGAQLLMADLDGDGERTMVVKGSSTTSNLRAYVLVDDPLDVAALATALVVEQEDLGALVAADFSGDGSDELLFEWYNDSYYYGPENGGLTLAEGVDQVIDFGFQAILTEPGDINGDGRADVLVIEPNGLLVATADATGQLEFRSALPIDFTVQSANLWDANHDGYDDVVVQISPSQLSILWGGPGF